MQKKHNSGTVGYDREGWVPRVGGWGHKIWKQTELRHSAFSRAESAVMPCEVREGMEGKHTPETDLTRCHQVVEEGDKFESLLFRLDRCCFLALLRVDTLGAGFVE